MSDWITSYTPQLAHLHWVERGHYALASQFWATCLSALGARILFAWSASAHCGLAIPIFSRLRLIRLGFLGFPIAGSILDQLAPPYRQQLIRSVLEHEHIHILRITSGAQAQPPPHYDGARPDVWISDVQAFRPSHVLKRDLAFSERALSKWRIDDATTDGAAWHELYRQVINRHQGRQIYSIAYFRALSNAAQSTDLIKGWSLVDDLGIIRAFAVFAQHGEDGIYLHSAADECARKKGASDALLARLVAYARDRQCRRLLLLASPWEQPGLVRFKRKWGDQYGYSVTYHQHRGITGAILKRWFALRLRRDRRLTALESAQGCV